MLMLLPILLRLIEYVKDKRVVDLLITVFLFLVIFVPLSNTNREYSVFEKLFMGTSMLGGEIITIAMFVAFVMLISTNIFKKENWSKYIYSGVIIFVLFFVSLILYIISRPFVPIYTKSTITTSGDSN